MAILVQTNGKLKEVHPKNGADFSLEELRNFVGGHIEVAKTKNGYPMVINEEGKLIGLPLNVIATILYGNDYDCIVGEALLITNKDELK